VLILINRVQDALQRQLGELQSGFRPQRGTMDHIFTLRQIVNMAHTNKQSVFCCFIDLQKAYDSINREALWVLLAAYGVPAKIISLLRDLHDGSKAVVRLDGVTSEPFDVRTGVRQGCVGAPLLFNVFIDAIVRRVIALMPGTGVTIKYKIDGHLVRLRTDRLDNVDLIPLLMYADDIVLLATNYDKLVEMLDKFDEVATQFGMTVSVRKTKIMCITPDTTPAEPADDAAAQAANDAAARATVAAAAATVAALVPAQGQPCMVCSQLEPVESVLSCVRCAYVCHAACLQPAAVGQSACWVCAHCAYLEQADKRRAGVARQRFLETALPCMACGLPDIEPVPMLLCDGPACNRGMHINCLQPALDQVPGSDWHCAHCVADPTAPQPQPQPRPPVMVRGQVVEEVSVFKYLGSMISADNNTTPDLSYRLSRAGHAFSLLKPLFSHRHLHLRTKVRLYKAVVLTNLLYGCETWALLKFQSQRLEVFHMRCLRNIMGLSIMDQRDQHLTNEHLLDRCYILPIADVMQQYRLRWLGHVGRMGDDRLPKHVLFGRMEGQRPRGRPPRSFADVVVEDVQWMCLPRGVSSWYPLSRKRHGQDWLLAMQKHMRVAGELANTTAE
jgi:hypothetical protein